jgi:hypothetical protein
LKKTKTTNRLVIINVEEEAEVVAKTTETIESTKESKTEIAMKIMQIKIKPNLKMKVQNKVKTISEVDADAVTVVTVEEEETDVEAEAEVKEIAHTLLLKELVEQAKKTEEEAEEEEAVVEEKTNLNFRRDKVISMRLERPNTLSKEPIKTSHLNPFKKSQRLNLKQNPQRNLHPQISVTNSLGSEANDQSLNSQCLFFN